MILLKAKIIKLNKTKIKKVLLNVKERTKYFKSTANLYLCS